MPFSSYVFFTTYLNLDEQDPNPTDQVRTLSTFRFRPRPGKRPDSRRHVPPLRSWRDPRHPRYCLQDHLSWLEPCQQRKYGIRTLHPSPLFHFLLIPAADQQYLEFKRDIQTLRKQLRTLAHNIGVVDDDEHAQLAPTGQFHDIFADFHHTLEDCQRFLDRNNHFAAQRGPMANIQWALWAKDEVDMHRDRIAVLNLKLNLALQSLQM